MHITRLFQQFAAALALGASILAPVQAARGPTTPDEAVRIVLETTGEDS